MALDTPEEEPAEEVNRGPHDFVVREFHKDVHVFRGEWDDEGVFFYQAYKDEIADWAVEHQRFGGPEFNARRMTWIKPSFAWVLYRSGYGHKHHQERVLKIKLRHEAVAELLSRCQCKEGGGGSNGRVQWDPARDMLTVESCGKVPREMRDRAIQIGLKGPLSEHYVNSVISVEDVTALSHAVGAAHKAMANKVTDAMQDLQHRLPDERPYMPCCKEPVLRQLRMLPGAPPEQRVRRSGRR